MMNAFYDGWDFDGMEVNAMVEEIERSMEETDSVRVWLSEGFLYTDEGKALRRWCFYKMDEIYNGENGCEYYYSKEA